MPKQKQAIFPLALATSLSALPYLPLGMIVAHLRCHNDGILAREYQINRILVAGCDDRPVELVYKAIAEATPSICLFSVYSWNHDFNLEVAAKVRQIAPASLIIFGGPDVPKFEDDTEAYLHNHPFIDIAVREEGEAACAEILEVMAGNATRNTA
jgi:hypothetical protein